ncbi:cell division protein ZapE [Amphritea pacifica]|uniref:AFG1 family ATPase n=1 Tax=Amphritea pacifica TaxID=2811233 RepID=A0ABS2W8T3_9GAMM|nr:cell division protein ZapE [Amphritea pacifica]MBN0988130.1 AFG1 family ATPase [Amphritea pacifica]MBN1007573.1 AFG1 family ATPase [Amphritea pacifica]
MQTEFIDIYQQALISHGYQHDPAQLRLVEALNPVYTSLISGRHRAGDSAGIYIWGPVGRGKTFLMDLMFAHLPDKICLRLHFHRFMAQTHQQLTVLQGKPDPLELIAQKLARQYQLICFDEFFLNDIADAMILGKLFRSLLKRGVRLITTSNRPPEKLCKDPLFEDRVRPIIAMINQQMRVFNLAGETDHRLRSLTPSPCIFHSNDTDAERQLTKLYTSISSNLPRADEVIVMQRPIPAKAVSPECVWFDFEHICMGARSQMDYIELANRFSHIFVSQVPLLGSRSTEQIKARGTEDGSEAVKAGERQVLLGSMDDPARRFISLVDELYDRGVNLFLSVEVPLEKLYMEGSLVFEFARTYSRLTEMQSWEYQQRQPNDR